MKLVESRAELLAWEGYREYLKEQLKLVDGEAPFLVSKDKLDFDLGGKPWRGHALLSGPKAVQTARKLKKDGLVFREGACRRSGKELVVSGDLPPKLLKEAERTLLKLRLGYKLAGGDGGGDGGGAAADLAKLKAAVTPLLKSAVDGGGQAAASLKRALEAALAKERSGDPAAALDAWRRIGDAVRRSKEPAAGKVQEFDFEDDAMEPFVVPVTDVDPGIPIEQQIVNHLQDFEDAIQNYWANYALGLENFVTRMSFDSDQAAEPKHLQAVFKALAKHAFDEGLKQAGKKLGGPWGEVIATVKTAVDAWSKESERAAKAAGGVKIADYVESIRNGIPGQRDRMIAAVEAKKRPLIDEFQRLAAGDPSRGKPSDDHRLVGEAAGLLKQLAADVAAFKRSIPSPSSFQQRFSTRFADTPGMTGKPQHGARPTGMLYFRMALLVEPGDVPEISLKSSSDAWKLVTKAPDPDRVATSLARSLEGRKPWEIDLPKMVQLDLEIEVTGMNKVQSGFIHFTKDPRRYEVRSNYGAKWFDLVWGQPTIRDRALKATKLVGSSK